jgi:4-amino-4-deoxy-L-arabinose transferase-like glycosyltransferase
MTTLLKALTLIYFVALATTFAAITPVAFGFDEDHHLSYVSYVARTGSIPNQDVADQSIRYEGHQPPLYYFLAAGCLRAVGIRDAVAGSYLLRAFSVLLGTFNLALVFRVAAYFPLGGLWRLAPALFVATLPQFAFVSGMVSNDSLANLMATAVILSLLAIHRHPLQWPAYICLGCYLGLGIMVKKTTLFLIPGAGVVVGYLLWQTHGRRRLIALRSVVAMALSVMLSGWWFLRNRQLYGEWLGTAMEARSMHYIFDPKPLWSPYFIGRFSDLRSARLLFLETLLAIPALLPFCVGVVIVFTAGLLGSVHAWRTNRRLLIPAATLIVAPALLVVALLAYFFCNWYSAGDFGWQLYLSAICHLASYDLELPFGLYAAYGCLLGAAVVGLVQYVKRQRWCDMRTVIAILFVSMCFAGVVYYNTMYNQAQGRFLFPVLPLIGVLVALGLQALLSNRQKWLQALVVAAITGLVVVGDAVSVAMAYVYYQV